MLEMQKRLNLLPLMHSEVSTKCDSASLFQYYFIILFAGYTVYGRISTFLVQIFQRFLTLSTYKDLSLHIVQLNLVDGATVLFAAYSGYGRIFVHPPSQIFCLLRCFHPIFC